MTRVIFFGHKSLVPTIFMACPTLDARAKPSSFRPLIWLSVNFGPAHPAAHGVFRLHLSLSSEIAVTLTHSQGLLWRSTEGLVEYRHSSLATGYFARMDYVAFLSQELALSLEKSKRLQSLPFLEVMTNSANHLLNLACTVADAGALGAILWAFEVRELIAEEVEASTGARLHLNLAFLALGASSSVVSISTLATADLLLSGVVTVRTTRARLASNFVLTAELASSAAATGWLLHGSGLSDDPSP